jgi:hypothetical protein
MKGDCCGLCFCKPDSVICCNGYFLTKEQKKFVGIETGEEEESDSSVGDSKYASAVEKFLSTVYAEKILTVPGRVSILGVWAILAAMSIYGACNMNTDFSMEMFIPEGTNTDKFY